MQTTIVHGVELESAGDAVVMAVKREGSFEDAAVAAWRRALSVNRLALDIGCYTGLYSIIADQEGCPCLGFEPNPVAVDRAHSNAELNGCLIDVQNIALSSSSGYSQLHLKGGRDLTSAASIVTAHGQKSIEVQTTTLDDLSFDMPVGVIKIDAERAEPDIIEGGARLIDRDRPVIITECLDGASTIAIYKSLDNLDYRPTVLDSVMVEWRHIDGA